MARAYAMDNATRLGLIIYLGILIGTLLAFARATTLAIMALIKEATRPIPNPKNGRRRR